MPKGNLCLVLHAHLPYVRHPEHEYFLEEDWLFEAITETYIPLLNVFEGLVRDRVPFKITMSLTPPLLAMLVDPLLQSRYLRHLNKLIELAGKEIDRTRWQSQFNELALMYHFKLNQARDIFANQYKNNLVQGFKKFQDLGVLEVITCAATHGFLPLMTVNRNAARAQIQFAVEQYQQHLGRPPRGIWLPECGYDHGADEILKEFGIRYFFMEAHGILHATPRPKYGVYAPIFCRSGVAAFARDLESSKQVWSAEEGYPGDYDYREFYRDIGFDLDFEYIKPYIHPDGTRINTGIKYYRITGPTNDKQPYNAHVALEKAASHAGNFMFNREKQFEYLHNFLGRAPIIVAPYDAELFGHWWYEGPDFLNLLIRKVAFDQNIFKLGTAMDYLHAYPRNQVAAPSLSSWGYKGYSEVWLEGSNDWIYPHLHVAADRMVELAQANNHNGVTDLKKRALNQAARELLLAQSSDWAFIMKTGTVVPYAVKRTKDHMLRFNRLYEEIRQNKINEAWLNEIESKDNIFPNINYRAYA